MNLNARWQVTIEAQRYLFLYTFSKRNVIHHWTMSNVISKRISVHGTTQYVLTHLPRELRFSYATVYRFTLHASLVCKNNSELPTNWKKKKDKKVSLLNELGDEKEETFDVWKETQFFDINIIFFSLWNDKWQHRRNASEKMPVYFFQFLCDMHELTCCLGKLLISLR